MIANIIVIFSITTSVTIEVTILKEIRELEWVTIDSQDGRKVLFVQSSLFYQIHDATTAPLNPPNLAHSFRLIAKKKQIDQSSNEFINFSIDFI